MKEKLINMLIKNDRVNGVHGDFHVLEMKLRVANIMQVNIRDMTVRYGRALWTSEGISPMWGDFRNLNDPAVMASAIGALRRSIKEAL